MQKLLKEGKFDELQYEMRELVHYDLRAIDLASFLIVNYDLRHDHKAVTSLS